MTTMIAWSDPNDSMKQVQSYLNVLVSIIGLLVIIFLWSGQATIKLNSAYFTAVISQSVNNTLILVIYGGVNLLAGLFGMQSLLEYTTILTLVIIYLKSVNCTLRMGLILYRVMTLTYPQYMMTKFNKFALFFVAYCYISLFSLYILLFDTDSCGVTGNCHGLVYNQLQTATVISSVVLSVITVAELFFNKGRRKVLPTVAAITKAEVSMTYQSVWIIPVYVFEYIIYAMMGTRHIFSTLTIGTDWQTFFMMFYVNILVIIFDTLTVVILNKKICQNAIQYLWLKFCRPNNGIAPEQSNVAIIVPNALFHRPSTQNEKIPMSVFSQH